MKDLSAAVEAELKKQGVSREEAQELTLNECRVSDLSILKGLDALEVLSICVSDLKTLEGFPPLPSLVKLDVSDNKIVDGLQSLAACPKVHVNSFVSCHRVGMLSGYEPGLGVFGMQLFALPHSWLPAPWDVQLAKVILDNNRVASVEQIEALKDCKALESLSLVSYLPEVWRGHEMRGFRSMYANMSQSLYHQRQTLTTGSNSGVS